MSNRATDAAGPPSAHAAPVWSIYAAAWMMTAVFILSNSATPLYVLWQRKIGFSHGTLAAIFAVYILGLLLALAFAGRLSDRWGRKAVLLPGLTIAILACLLFVTASSVAALSVARFLMGIAVGVTVSAGTAALVDLGGVKRRRNTAFAASLSIALGSAFGPMISSIFARFMPDPIVSFHCLGLAVVVSAFIAALLLPLPKGQPRRKNEQAPASPPRARGRRSYLVGGICIFATGMAGTAFLLALGPSLLMEVLQVKSPLITGATICLMFLAGTATQIMVRRLSLRAAFLIGAAATVVAMAGLIVAVNAFILSALVVAMLAAGVGQGLSQLGSVTLVTLRVPVERRAEELALLNMGAYLPAGLLPVCAGWLTDDVGLSAGTTAFAGIVAAATIVSAPYVLACARAE